jgi:hypothetical protein
MKKSATGGAIILFLSFFLAVNLVFSPTMRSSLFTKESP